MKKEVNCSSENEKKCYKKGLLSVMEKFKNERNELLGRIERTRQEGIEEGKTLIEDEIAREGRKQGTKFGKEQERDAILEQFSIDAYNTLKNMVKLSSLDDVTIKSLVKMTEIFEQSMRQTINPRTNRHFPFPSKATRNDYIEFLHIYGFTP
jgi:hypothetical protein